MISAQLIFSIADEVIFTRGEFDPVQFLVAAGLLEEGDYRDWLSGQRPELQSRLQCGLDEAIDALEQARGYLRKQGLTAQPRPTPLSGAQQRVGTSPELVELCSVCLVPAAAQRDLFQDSAAAAAENAVRVALGGHRLGAAERALALMRDLGAAQEATDSYRLLIEAAGREAVPVERLRELEDIVTPLASQNLGNHAFAYLTTLWRSLARQLRGTQFSASAPKLHASYANLMATQWQSVIDDVESEPDWQRHSVLVTRLAEAYARASNRPAARRAWALLCWTHSDAAAEALGAACADPLLARRWREFSDAEPELPSRDFPAWLLIADPAQRGFVPSSLAPQSATGAAYAAMYRLVLHADDIAARKDLKAYSADLLEHYFAARSKAER